MDELKDDPELTRLIAEAKARVSNMSQEEFNRMYLEQKASYVRAEADWPETTAVTRSPDPAVVELVRAARQLHDNIAEYRRINNLPGPPNDDAVAVARALAQFKEIMEE